MQRYDSSRPRSFHLWPPQQLIVAQITRTVSVWFKTLSISSSGSISSSLHTTMKMSFLLYTRREKKSSLVIPVKLWMKRIAGAILRRWRSPQRQVFQDVTRVVALMRSCEWLQCRLFLPLTQCGATTPYSFISLSCLPHLWLEASSHSADLV